MILVANASTYLSTYMMEHDSVAVIILTTVLVPYMEFEPVRLILGFGTRRFDLRVRDLPTSCIDLTRPRIVGSMTFVMRHTLLTTRYRYVKSADKTKKTNLIDFLFICLRNNNPTGMKLVKLWRNKKKDLLDLQLWVISIIKFHLITNISFDWDNSFNFGDIALDSFK